MAKDPLPCGYCTQHGPFRTQKGRAYHLSWAHPGEFAAEQKTQDGVDNLSGSARPVQNRFYNLEHGVVLSNSNDTDESTRDSPTADHGGRGSGDDGLEDILADLTGEPASEVDGGKLPWE